MSNFDKCDLCKNYTAKDYLEDSPDGLLGYTFCQKCAKYMKKYIDMFDELDEQHTNAIETLFNKIKIDKITRGGNCER